MVKEIDRESTEEFEKVLVCITAQSNSKRLINKGAEVADKLNGELHILHVQKGNSIFNNSETPKLLQELFQYGSEKGAMVHFYCDDNIPESIASFIHKERVTRLVLGEPPCQTVSKKEFDVQFHKIISALIKDMELIIVGREEKEYIAEKERIKVV